MSEIIRHLIIKRSQGLSKVLNGNKVGFSLWWVLLLKRKRTYSMQVMGIDGPVVLVHGNRQPAAGGSQDSSVFPEAREPKISFLQPQTKERTTPGRHGRNHCLAGQLWARFSVLVEASITAFLWFLPTGGICIWRLLVPWHEAKSKRFCSPFVICWRKMVWFVYL